jgi:hypothetical protein
MRALPDTIRRSRAKCVDGSRFRRGWAILEYYRTWKVMDSEGQLALQEGRGGSHSLPRARHPDTYRPLQIPAQARYVDAATLAEASIARHLA